MKPEANAPTRTRRWIKWLDYFFVMRPTLFFPVWTVFLAGFFSAGMAAGTPSTGEATNGVGPSVMELVPLAIALTLLMGGVFVINQLHDVRSDRANNKLFLVAEGHLSRPAAKKEAYLLVGLGLLMGLVTGFLPLILLVALFGVAGVLYSVRPYSWKDHPLLGWLANALGGFLIFALGWSLRAENLYAGAVRALPYVLAISAVYLYTTIPDARGDQESGKVTFAVRYGKKLTRQLGALLEVLALVGAFRLGDPILFYPALFTAPLFLWAAFTGQLRDVVRAVKWSILLLSIFVCVEWPGYFVVLLAVYFLSKWYYRLRFGIHYPNLST